MGGMNDSEKYSAELVSIDFGDDLATLSPQSSSEKDWEKLPSMNQARSDFACVSDSNYIYVIGGVDAKKKALSTAERYHVKTKKWTILPNMPGKRSGCGAAIVDDKIFVVGGDDMDDNELASTFVFNISEQKWGSPDSYAFDTPPVPDMKHKRGMLSVVAVDHYIVAVGGGDENGNLLSTIEVLDTQRNVWNYARTPMDQGYCYRVAGCFKGTKEFILAGGANESAANVTNLVDSINFESGLLPHGFRNKERGQKIVRDMDQGKDQLGMAVIAEALAEMLVFKDLEPPFVLGILGKWGRGRSYFFNLMMERIIKTQKTPVNVLVQNTFVGHTYVVKFNAWAFSKGNIWSSLLYQIYKNLNEQLQFEEEMGSGILEAGDVSTIEVFRDLSTGNADYLKKHTKRIRETYQRVKKNGDRASEPLLKVINASYKQDQEDLRSIKREIQLIRQRIIQKQGRCAITDIERIIVMRAVKKALRHVVAAKIRREDDISVDSADVDLSYEELVESIEHLEDYKNLIEEIKDISWWNYRCRCSNVPAYALICSALLLILSFVLFLVFKDITVTAVSGVLSAMFPIVTNFTTATKKIDPVITNLENQAMATADLEAGSVDVEDLEELKDRERKKEEIENRTLALKGCSLQDAITIKTDSKKYESNIGIVRKVQQDLQRLSDGMFNRRHADILFPRGDPRIVLFIEDLDRCEQSVVVEVIEALQLIVKTKLFVSVVAIDPKFATLSLENHYKGILDAQTPLSGMEFIEKIIQIPFSLPAVGQDYVDNFVSSQIEIEEVQDTEESVEFFEVGDNKIPGSISVITTTNTSKPPGSRNTGKSQVLSKSSSVEESEYEALPVNKVCFTERDKTMLTNMLKLFGVDPRCMRRTINIFKVLLVIWRRDNKRFKADYNLRRATLFLMLLSSEESTREATCTIFEMMELGMMKYHQVVQSGPGGLKNENNLANLFKTELQKWDKSFVLPFMNQASIKGTLMAYIDEYLTEYSWTSMEEWNRISSKFLLARCFSFSHLVSEERAVRQQSLNFDHVKRIIDSGWSYSNNLIQGRGYDSGSNIDGGKSQPLKIEQARKKVHDLRLMSANKLNAVREVDAKNGGQTNGLSNGHTTRQVNFVSNGHTNGYSNAKINDQSNGKSNIQTKDKINVQSNVQSKDKTNGQSNVQSKDKSNILSNRQSNSMSNMKSSRPPSNAQKNGQRNSLSFLSGLSNNPRTSLSAKQKKYPELYKVQTWDGVTR